MTYALQPFNPADAADPNQARFDKQQLWGESASSTKRPDYISTTSGQFAAMVGGQQLGNRLHEIDVVILKQQPEGRATGRTFFGNNYDPSNTSIPDCHSDNGIAPAANSKKPQSATCATCPQNMAGSGATAGSRACRYSKTLVVAVPSFGNKLMTVKLSAQALFAAHDPQDNSYGLFALDAVLGRRLPQEIVTKLTQPQGSTGGVRLTPVGMLDVQTATGYVQMSQSQEACDMVKVEADVPGLALSRTQGLPAPAQAQPAMTFGQPQPQLQMPAPVYQAPPQQAQATAYYAPPVQQPMYQQPPAPVYQAPPAPVYQQPPAPVYQQPPAPVYQQPAEPVYAAPPVQPMAPPPMAIPPVPHQVAQPIENVAPPTAVVKQEAPAAASPVYVDRLAAAFQSR